MGQKAERTATAWMSIPVIATVLAMAGARYLWGEQPPWVKAQLADTAQQAAMVIGVVGGFIALGLGALWLVVRVARSAWRQ